MSNHFFRLPGALLKHFAKTLTTTSITVSLHTSIYFCSHPDIVVDFMRVEVLWLVKVDALRQIVYYLTTNGVSPQKALRWYLLTYW